MDKVDEVRDQSLKILLKIFQDKSYSNILIKNLGQKFSALDRSFITELVYGTVKYRLRIDNSIGQLSKVKLNKMSPEVLNILRMGIYQLDYMSRVPESASVNESVKLAKKYSNIGAVKFVNAILRNYIRNKDNITYPDKNSQLNKFLSVYYSYPEWLVDRLIKEWGAESTENFLKSSNEIPPLTVRVNRLKTDKSNLRDRLSGIGIESIDGSFMDDALILKNVPGIESMKDYREGHFTVQDESSMLAVRVLAPEPREFIMDVCSAPGTKTTYMGELMNNQGTLIAGDISCSKLKLVDENARRLGITTIHTICHSASIPIEEYMNKADRVLVDAPCSGLGLLRKKPEIRWNRTPSEINDILKLQRDILYNSCNYVKPGGVLVYSTCTILEAENYGIISKFVKDNSNFILEDITGLIPDKLKRESIKDGYIYIFPEQYGTDGFFIARLRRVE